MTQSQPPAPIRYRRPALTGLAAGAMLLAAVAACDRAPRLVQPAGLTESLPAMDTTTPPPKLLPVDQLLARSDAATVSDETAASLAARGAALRARAAAIQSDQ